jgi:tetratricopeptide (TPR) repeat protein
LEEKFPDIVASQPALLAHHCTEAGLIEKAVPLWGKAGEKALHSSTSKEAIAQFQKALELAKQLGNGSAQRLMRLRLQTSYAYALVYGRGHGSSEATAAFRGVRELAASLEEPTERFSAYYGLWTGSFARGELGSAREVVEAFLKDAERCPGSPEFGIAHRLVGSTCWFEGNYIGAQAHLDQALVCYDSGRDRGLTKHFGFDPGTFAMSYLALVLWPMGKFARAAHSSESALHLAREIRHVPTIVVVRCWRCFLAGIRRSSSEVIPEAEAVISLAREHGLEQWLAHATFFLGWGRWCAEGNRNGEFSMREGLATLNDMDVQLFAPLHSTLFAELEADTGQAKQGLATLDTQLALIQQTGQRWFESEMHRVRGQVLLRTEIRDEAAAEAAFMRAIKIGANQRTKAFELRASMNLARLWRDQGKQDEARDLLAPVYNWFTEGFDTRDLKEAKALLDELAS